MSIKVYKENNSTIPTQKKMEENDSNQLYNTRNMCLLMICQIKSSKELHLRWHRYVINKIRLL
jgi:hypothetical protein